MNLLTRSTLARIGAATLLSAGLVAVGAPAQASDPTDLALIPLSTQLAKGVSEAKAKPFRFTVDNSRSSADAREVRVTVDARQLKKDRVGFVVPDGCQPQQQTDTYSCLLGDLPAGTSEDFGVPLFSTGGTGAGGTLVVTVSSATPDPEIEDNTVELDVTVTDAGYDLVTWAQDVYADVVVNGVEETGLKPVRPGETAPLDWAIYNGGSRQATGLFYGITLPVGVSFDQLPAHCVVQDWGLAQAFCEDPAVVLKPGEYYTDSVRVKVAEGVTEPVLRVGNIFAYGLTQAKAGTALRQPRIAAQPQVKAFDEADGGDNSAVFDVYVDLSAPSPSPSPQPSVSPSVSPSASPSVSPSDPPAGGGGGGDGGLPVTGAQIGLIGGVGGLVLLVGGVLMVLSRRRRVVLVTPTDEKSAD